MMDSNTLFAFFYDAHSSEITVVTTQFKCQREEEDNYSENCEAHIYRQALRKTHAC